MKTCVALLLVLALLLLPVGCASGTTPTLSKVEAQTVAQTKLDAYWTSTVFGVCCEMEYVEKDLSRFVTDAQSDFYNGGQWRITCCRNAQEVTAHLRRHMADHLRTTQPEDGLFHDDQNNLYVVVPGRGSDSYRVSVKEFSDTRIVALCEILEMGSTDLVACCYDFTLEKQNGEFVIVERSDYYV